MRTQNSNQGNYQGLGAGKASLSHPKEGGEENSLTKKKWKGQGSRAKYGRFRVKQLNWIWETKRSAFVAIWKLLANGKKRKYTSALTGGGKGKTIFKKM